MNNFGIDIRVKISVLAMNTTDREPFVFQNLRVGCRPLQWDLDASKPL